ncbi:MAG: aldo/keto reductase [Myxococcota bacterium]
MKYVEVRGMKAPALGMGTWQLQGRPCRQAVERALELGYRHIDTAQMYGNEEMVGAALQASGLPRDEVFLTTKLGLDDLARDAVARTTRESLKRLATDRIDLLLIHWPSDRVPLGETLEAMMALQEEGVVSHIGVSNFPPALLREALHMAPVSCIQVEYHPYLAQPELLDMSRRRDLMLTAYSPLARGRVPGDRVLRQLAERHGKTPSQVALRWLIQQDHVSAIPKASSEAHLRENIDIFDFQLKPEEMRMIWELDRGERLLDPPWAPDWDRT